MKITMKRVRVAALLATLALTATACSTTKKPPQTQAKPAAATSSTTLADPTTTVDAGRAAVLTAYKQYWDTYKHSLSEADPDDPGLAAHLTGEQLGLLRVQLTGLRDAPKPEFVRVTADIHPRVIVLESARAVVQDCFTETDAFFTRDGQPSGTPQSFKAGGEFELVLEGGVWKVSKKTHKDNACPG